MRSSRVFLHDSAAEHILPVNENKHSFTHAWTWGNLSNLSETGPLAALRLLVLLQKKEKQSRKCAEPAVSSQPIPGTDILALRNDAWEHTLADGSFKETWKYTKGGKKRRDHIMAWGMRRPFVAWTPAPAHRQWWRWRGSGISAHFIRFITFSVHTEGSSWS